MLHGSQLGEISSATKGDGTCAVVSWGVSWMEARTIKGFEAGLRSNGRPLRNRYAGGKRNKTGEEEAVLNPGWGWMVDVTSRVEECHVLRWKGGGNQFSIIARGVEERARGLVADPCLKPAADCWSCRRRKKKLARKGLKKKVAGKGKGGD